MGNIDSLAQSMADIGLLHPVVVTPKGTLIAGERRFAAAMRSTASAG
jgi:ParB-like chromosome segregation protein Spo0J